jgi:flagellar hook-associated protein 1
LLIDREKTVRPAVEAKITRCFRIFFLVKKSMSNYGARILNNSVQALSAQQALIGITANNISNVNTEGYVRRSANLQTRTSRSPAGVGEIGSGVQVGKLQRTTDQYIEKMLQEAAADKSSLEIQKSFLERAEKLFTLSGEGKTIGSSLSQFFTAINDLRANPSSIELRSNLVQKGENLVDTIKNTYNDLARLQEEADARIANELQTVNEITAQIAELNGVVKARESGGNVAADERDQREKLIAKLSEKISFTKLEVSDGSVQINLSNGFTLVSGTTFRKLDYTETPSFATATPPSLAGQKLGYIVYDYDAAATTAHIDLTQILKNDGGGMIGGLLKVRGVNNASNTSAFSADGTIVGLASRVEALTRNLLTTFNNTYLGVDENSAGPGFQSNAGDLNGNPPDVYGFFDFDFNGVKDVNTDIQANDIDNPAIGIDSYSRILRLNNTDPRRIAASRDVDPANASRVFPPGNAENLKALADLQNQNFTFSRGSYQLIGTFSENYNETVTYISNAKSRTDIDYTVAEKNLVAAQARRDEISAVSLDEEFAALIKYQKAYEASARMIKVSDEILEQILQLI